ncbi:MAG: hypothetical protein LBH43_21755 [Treponema sp.]|jgi:hypothetical protein|nr:hypothetical protein [Treponema sp.]
MKTPCLLVLVPHRDARQLLKKYSGSLFAAGFWGAWSFPWVAPLAALSSPLSPAELKQLAAIFREKTLALNSGGKMQSLPPAQSPFPDDFPFMNSCNAKKPAIFGPALDFTIPELAVSLIENKARHWFSPLVFGAALINEASTPPASPALSFRACALANMDLRPLAADGYSYSWKIGKLCWLPPVRKN